MASFHLLCRLYVWSAAKKKLEHMIEMQTFVIDVHNYSENLEFMKIVFLIDLEHIAWTAKTVNNIFIWISTDMTLHDSTAIIDSFYISSLLSSSACVSQSSVILII